MMFKQLTKQEKASYRQWAIENYEPLSEIKGIWHPIIQAECVSINEKYVAGGDVTHMR